MLTVNLHAHRNNVDEGLWAARISVSAGHGLRAGPPAPIPRLVRSTATVCQAGCPCQTTARLGSNSTMISHHTNSFHESLKSHLLVSNFPQHDRIGRAGASGPDASWPATGAARAIPRKEQQLH